MKYTCKLYNHGHEIAEKLTECVEVLFQEVGE